MADDVALLGEDEVRDGGGRKAGALGVPGRGGGGGLALTSASQLIFLLGWLDIRSRVLVIFVAPASATLAALARSSNIMLRV